MMCTRTIATGAGITGSADCPPGTFQTWGGRQPTPGAGGRPQGCCGLNARAAASDLLVEAGRYFSRYASLQEERYVFPLLYFLLCLSPSLPAATAAFSRQ